LFAREPLVSLLANQLVHFGPTLPARSLLKIKKNGARPPRSVDWFGLMALFPREFFKKNGARQQLALLAMAVFRSEALLVFTITNIFNVFVPASPAI
jgi:hypothetical protein